MKPIEQIGDILEQHEAAPWMAGELEQHLSRWGELPRILPGKGDWFLFECQRAAPCFVQAECIEEGARRYLMHTQPPDDREAVPLRYRSLSRLVSEWRDALGEDMTRLDEALMSSDEFIEVVRPAYPREVAGWDPEGWRCELPFQVV